MTLLKLKDGQQGRVQSIDKHSPCYHRLLELGFTEGESITLVRKAPLGGPIQVMIRNSSYAIRRDDAATIQVS